MPVGVRGSAGLQGPRGESQDTWMPTVTTTTPTYDHFLFFTKIICVYVLNPLIFYSHSCFLNSNVLYTFTLFRS